MYIQRTAFVMKLLVTSAFLFGISSCTPPVPPSISDPTQPVQLATASRSADLFVDGTLGSDSNPGSSAQPWKTIQKASDNARAGDTITVRAGNYDERVRVDRSGSAASPITIQADGKVTMHGFTIQADYITIRSFEITDTPNKDEDGAGIFVRGSFCDLENNYIYFATRGGINLAAEPGHYAETASCTVRNNRLDHNSQYGINIEGRDHVVVGNEIWRTIQYHPAWTNPPSWVDADGIRFFGSGHILQHNYIHDIDYSSPENVNPHIDCFQTWQDENHEAASNVIIEQNRCENAFQPRRAVEGGTGFTISNGNGIIIRNNLAKAFVDVFIKDSNGISILNNTLTGETSFDTDYFPSGVQANNSTNIAIENNIIFNQPGQIIYVKGGGVTGDKNLLYRDDGIPLSTLQTYIPGTDLWDVNPLFVNPAGNDYHLQPQSPAIDAGAQLSNVPDDYDGNARPSGTGYDIGAFEFTGTK